MHRIFKIMNEPTYKIHGIERRQLKKELGDLKRYVKNFLYYHQLDKDMTSFYGGKEGYPMSDDEAQKRVDKAQNEVQQIENRLSVLYGA
jgi:hypothetical protein